MAKPEGPLWLDQMVRHMTTFGLSPGSDLVVHVVPNGVRGDSRVLKCAQVSRDVGRPTVIIGIAPAQACEAFEVEGIPVILVPFVLPQSVDPAIGRAALIRSWNKSMRDVHAWRVGRRFRRGHVALAGRAAVQSVRPRRRAEPSWAKAREAALGISVAFRDALRCAAPGMVHVHDAYPLAAAVAYGAESHLRRRVAVEVIYDAHECFIKLVESFPKMPVYRALKTIERQYIHDASQVITVSDEIADLLASTYGLAAKPRVVTNAPSEVRAQDSPKLREHLGLAEGVPIAVYSGWVDAQRGLGAVIKALPATPGVHLALVVNKPSRDLTEILRLAHRLGVADRVHTAPYVRPSQVTEYLSSATVGLIPLLGGAHLDLSLPTKFREYIHAGLPLVVSGTAAMAAEIERTGVGQVFEPRNDDELVHQLREVAGNPEPYRAAITEDLLAEYSWERQSVVLRDVYGAPSGRHDSSAELRPSSEAGLSEKSVPDGSAFSGTWSHRGSQYFHVSLGVGRANSAGQAWAWARTLREHLDVVAESFAPSYELCAGPDVVVRKNLDAVRGGAELGRIVDRYTYLLVDGFSSLSGDFFRGDLGAELEFLRTRMYRIGLVAHGSDVRDPDRHMSGVQGSYFRHAPAEWVEQFRTISAQNRLIAAEHGGPLFVSTPDLLSDLPTAHWLPVTVDLERWESVESAAFGRKLRVLHRPSRTTPPIKGSDVIDPVLERLEKEGLIERIDASGPVPVAEMPALVESADVVIDQIRTGSYGVAACEALGAGRVVVGALEDNVRFAADRPIPIIDAVPDHFEESMRRLIETNRAELRELAVGGQDYVRALHSGERSAQVLEDHLLAP